MQPIFNKRLWGSLIAGLVSVCALGAMAATNGAAAAPANEPGEGTPRSPATQSARPTAPANATQRERATAPVNATQSAPTKPSVNSGVGSPGLWTPTPEISGLGIQVINPPAKAWMQIQWSDWRMQDWYPVDSWSGPLAQSDFGWGAVWYGRENFGTGPFRWVVFDGNPAEGGTIWGMSDTFYLDYFGGMMIFKEITQGENLANLPAAQVRAATPDPRLAFYAPKGAELKANPAGCGRYTIAGEVLSASGKAESEYRLRLTYPSGKTETVNAGGAPDYGKSGYGFLLGTYHSGQAYKLELLPIGQGAPVAPPVKITFSDNCAANYAWVVFQSQR